MKRLVCGLLALPLMGCGTLNALPTVGQLLDAPTALDFAGNTVTASSNSILNHFDNSLDIKVALKTNKKPIPNLKVTDVYMITNGGIWIPNYDKINQHNCAEQSTYCTLATGSGSAKGLTQGEGAQVVVQLKDEAGSTYYLRDQQEGKVGE